MSTQDKAAPTDEQILAAARAMNKLAAEACGVDEADHWALYGNSQIIDASVILRAALASTQQAEPAQAAVPPTREQEIAIKEGERIAASDRYFGARTYVLDTAANRRLFEAGFDAAWGVKLDKEQAR
jgi:hypothetical protein